MGAMMRPERQLERLPVPLRRPAIEAVKPCIEGGRFPIKRTVGESVAVTAAIHADGHEVLSAAVLYRPASTTIWTEVQMEFIENDEWRGQFRIDRVEEYRYTIQAWVNSFLTWQADLVKRFEAHQDLTMEMLVGAKLVAESASRAKGEDARRLQEFADALKTFSAEEESAGVDVAANPELNVLVGKYADRSRATTFENELVVDVDRERARFSTWYEMFPRSCTNDSARHGTFRDCLERLDYIANMGFDVLYFPPIHPIGRAERKGKNNTLHPLPSDVGSPWAIGAKEGGHKDIHPQLGSLQDFQALLKKANQMGIEIALDLAYQCAPDHPYAREHQEWFRLRLDGSIQYAENPPKKYQDIYPLNFESEAAGALCQELKSVVQYWISQGVRIFRVDNPHTKPYPFWEWLIGEIRKQCPDVIFLAEAFTRPKVMYRLAKLGFTQSYTYFAWRNTKWELMQYFTELTQTDVREFFRANLWPNTPDILTEYLQIGGRPAFLIRLILAATLGANYGIYGPAFELCENRPQQMGSEEYLDSEKYEIRAWDIDRPDSLRDVITRINRARRDNPALQRDTNLRFHPVDNDQLIAYSKVSEDLSDMVLIVVNLDPHHTQSGWVQVPLEHFQLDGHQSYQVHDLLTDSRYLWQGARNYVELDPRIMPGHIFRVRRRVHSEKDFDYFM
jgi:starch synthase (maltosyl-transferring)